MTKSQDQSGYKAVGQRVRLIGLARRPRAALLLSTALQASALMVLAGPGLAQPAVNARPQGGVVVGGQASITSAPTNTQITQSSQRAAIDWKSFDVGAQQSVTFSQPNASAIALNRVTGPDPSQIAGKISANGQLVLVNQSGVVFSQGAQVNAASLVVSAPGITNENFMAGKMVFDQAAKPGAQIVNNGVITVAQGGLAALVAPGVANNGVIQAKMGKVVLAGAEKHTIDLYGDGMLSIDVTQQVRQAPTGPDGKPVTSLVTNSGTIIADGGTIILTASAVDGIVQNLVSAGGTIQANSVAGKTGKVVVRGRGGNVSVDGQISVAGEDPGTTGGTVVVNTTGNVTIASGASINASGQVGGGTVAIGTTLTRAKGGAAVTPKLTASSVTVQKGAKIAANATVQGNGGNVTVLSTDSTVMRGAIEAKGGPQGGDGGFVEISGDKGLSLTGTLNLSAAGGKAGALLIDPLDLYVSDTQPGAGPFVITNADLPTVSAGGSPDAVTSSWVDPALLVTFGGNITLAATNDLFVSTTKGTANTLNIGANGLTLTAGNNLTVDRGFAISAGKINLTATSGGITLDGTSGVAAGLINLTQISKLASTSIGGTDIVMKAGGAIGLAGAAIGSTGTPANSLDVTGSSVSQLASGAIFAGTLKSKGGITGIANFAGATNAVSNLGAFGNTGGNFTLNDAGTALAVTGALNAGVQTVSLTASGLTQTAAGVITAGTLTGTVTGTTDLGTATNAVSNLGAFSSTGGNFTLNDAGTALAVTGALNAAGQTVSLTASGLTQTAAGVITAGTLTGTVTGTTDLGTATAM